VDIDLGSGGLGRCALEAEYGCSFGPDRNQYNLADAADHCGIVAPFDEDDGFRDIGRLFCLHGFLFDQRVNGSGRRKRLGIRG
jgi:hypothetical protein